MNIGDFNSRKIDKKNLDNNQRNNSIPNFIKELSNTLKNIEDNKVKERIDNLEKEVKEIRQSIKEINNNKKVEEGDVCVIYGLDDKKITLLNIENGKEFDIHISISDDSLYNLQEEGNNNMYKIKKNDLYNLDLGTKLKFMDGKYEIYNGEIDIKDDEVWYKLDELYSNLRDDENKNFIVKDITDEKVYLTYEDGGGFISRYRKIYPDFQIGDKVIKVNGKFVKK